MTRRMAQVWGAASAREPRGHAPHGFQQVGAPGLGVGVGVGGWQQAEDARA